MLLAARRHRGRLCFGRSVGHRRHCPLLPFSPTPSILLSPARRPDAGGPISRGRFSTARRTTQRRRAGTSFIVHRRRRFAVVVCPPPTAQPTNRQPRPQIRRKPCPLFRCLGGCRCRAGREALHTLLSQLSQCRSFGCSLPLPYPLSLTHPPTAFPLPLLLLLLLLPIADPLGTWQRSLSAQQRKPSHPPATPTQRGNEWSPPSASSPPHRASSPLPPPPATRRR